MKGWESSHHPFMFQGFDTWTFVKGMLYRIMIVYFVTSLLKSIVKFSISYHSTSNSDNIFILDFMGGRTGVGYNNTGTLSRGASLPSRNLFQPGQKFDLYIYLSDSVCFICGLVCSFFFLKMCVCVFFLI